MLAQDTSESAENINGVPASKNNDSLFAVPTFRFPVIKTENGINEPSFPEEAVAQ